MSPEITSNDPKLIIFRARGIYHHLIEALKGIYSRFEQNVKFPKPTFSTRHDAIRRTACACAICHLSENLLPAASYSRRVSDLKVPNKVHNKPGQHVSINLLFGGWLPCCATQTSPPSCVHAHEKYHWPQ